MLKTYALLTALLVASGASFGADLQYVAKSIALKDGTTVHIFKDGKMAMEDRLGRTVPMMHGEVMTTADGQRIIMVGNELARLEVIKSDHRSGN